VMVEVKIMNKAKEERDRKYKMTDRLKESERKVKREERERRERGGREEGAREKER
jgi:hypothetical protein